MKQGKKKTSAGTFIGPVSPQAKHLGGNAFPDGMPVCDPVKPGRRAKALSGPVHPGFPQAGSAYAAKSKKSAKKMKKTPVVGSKLQVADQNFDLYKPVRKTKSTIKGKPKRSGK